MAEPLELPTTQYTQINPYIKDSMLYYFKSRRDDVVFSRLGLGHTRLTHSYLLNREPPPLCTFCNVQLTVEHILIDCVHLSGHRPFINISSVKSLFESVPPGDIIDFLKDTDLYSRL